MKKLLAFVLVVAMIGSCSTAYAENGPIKKLGRGIANVGTCPLEVVAGIKKATDDSGALAGCTWGVLLGVVNTVKRAVVGAYEIISFPVPLPKDYEPILTDPEFFFSSETNAFGS